MHNLTSASNEGEGEISLSFHSTVPLESRVIFSNFISEHLKRRSTSGSVVRERLYHCPRCKNEVENRQAIIHRLGLGKTSIRCQYCDDIMIPLMDELEQRFGDPGLLRRMRNMDQQADQRTSAEIGISKSKAKVAVNEYDTFLAHNSLDKCAALKLAELLRRRGVNPWIDQEQVPPGRWFRRNPSGHSKCW